MFETSPHPVGYSDAQRVRTICDAQYGITFPMTGISSVRGPRAFLLFRWLAEQGGGPPRWNLHKYLVARDGVTVRGKISISGYTLTHPLILTRHCSA